MCILQYLGVDGTFLGDVRRTTMNALELKDLCSSWDGSSDAFAEIVTEALDVLGVYQHDLAREFEVAESTVSRWAHGVARPHPRAQKQIVRAIKKRAGRSSQSLAPEALHP